MSSGRGGGTWTMRRLPKAFEMGIFDLGAVFFFLGAYSVLLRGITTNYQQW